MPQSLSKVILHIIFSTRDRESWLDQKIRSRMHAYLATICRDLGGDGLRVSGFSDHVHIVTTLPRTLSQAEMIEQLKKGSSNGSKRSIHDIAVFSGSEATRHCRLARVNLVRSSDTWTRKKNIIESTRLKKNIARCCENTASSSTNDTFGTSSELVMRRAFSANNLLRRDPGALPQARND